MTDRSRFFASSQGRIRYDIHGEGTPVILVHDTPSSSFVWEKVWPHLAPQWQIVTYDLAGYGKSDKHADQDVRLRTQAHVLAELIAHLGHLGIERPHLVGHDFGAATVLGAHLVEEVAVRS